MLFENFDGKELKSTVTTTGLPQLVETMPCGF